MKIKWKMNWVNSPIKEFVHLKSANIVSSFLTTLIYSLTIYLFGVLKFLQIIICKFLILHIIKYGDLSVFYLISCEITQKYVKCHKNDKIASKFHVFSNVKFPN